MIAHTKAQADHKTACNATQDRKSENKIKKEGKQEGFSHYNTNKKIEPLAQIEINETLEWHPKIDAK